jgi:heme/copper-type cytochrome/quinol oxidase subunit 2
MKLNGWQRLWVVISIIIFVVAVFFTFEHYPKKSEIYSTWANETIEVVKKPGEHSFLIRMAYKDYSDEELIEKLHEKYAEKNASTKVKFDEIDKKYKNDLDNLPSQQTKHILICLTVYLCLIICIYVFGWSVGWVYRGFKSKQANL